MAKSNGISSDNQPGGNGENGLTSPMTAPSPRLETGIVEVEGDWPGVFIRGDNAASYAIALRFVLAGSDNAIHRQIAANLEEVLRNSSTIQGEPGNIQHIRADWETPAADRTKETV